MLLSLWVLAGSEPSPAQLRREPGRGGNRGSGSGAGCRFVTRSLVTGREVAGPRAVSWPVNWRLESRAGRAREDGVGSAPPFLPEGGSQPSLGRGDPAGARRRAAGAQRPRAPVAARSLATSG